MEAFGNIESIKKSIQKRYLSKRSGIEKGKEDSLKDIEKELEKKAKTLRQEIETLQAKEEKKAYSRIMNIERFNIKKEFQKKRETLINSVLNSAVSRAKEKDNTERYIEYVKRSLKKIPSSDRKIYCDSERYRKYFPDASIDDSIAGIKCIIDGVIYDFTFDNLIASKGEQLRQEINKILFKDKDSEDKEN